MLVFLLQKSWYTYLLLRQAFTQFFTAGDQGNYSPKCEMSMVLNTGEPFTWCFDSYKQKGYGKGGCIIALLVAVGHDHAYTHDGC